MSHMGNDIFKETLRETRVEKIYESLPDRCYTSIDTSDRAEYKKELDWRTEHCWKERAKPEVKHQVVVLPKNNDEDYWMEHQGMLDRLHEVYGEAKLYRDL